MANRQKGETGFDALGQTWTLRYGTNALCEIEDLFGRSALDVARDFEDETTVRIRSIRDFFFCGLKDHYPDVDAAKAGEIIDALGLDRVGTKIGEALALAFPSPDDTHAPGKPLDPAATG